MNEMTHQSIHKDFMLNGHQFDTQNDLLVYTLDLNPELHSFITDWLDPSPVLSVRTSGSTGIPKRIQLKKDHMVNSALATGIYFKLPAKTTALLCLSPAYIAGKMMLVRALVLGWYIDVIEAGSNPLHGMNKRYDFGAMVPLQLQNSINNINLIKKLIVGGGVVSKELQDKILHLKTEVFATYGMTETITHIAVKKLNNFETVSLEINRLAKANQNYQVLPDVKVSKDRRGCLVIDAPKISNEKVITNDLIELKSETQFEWLGRYDTIINSGGIKLIPEQIEEKLSKIINDQFFVSSLPDEKLGEKLILIIESHSRVADVIWGKVRNLDLLHKFERPKEVYFVDKFIITETKKINRIETLKSLFDS